MTIYQNTTSFSIAITSDPQYPWYDHLLPDGLKTDDQKKENSNRQITQRYASINELAAQPEGPDNLHPMTGVLINGDLTAFGHGWQLDKHKEQISALKIPYYPALGNHDYQNNVDDTANNGAASQMVAYMYGWLRLNAGQLNYDFSERSYYKFPENRTDYTGSLAYSFNIGKVHFVQLQNFPSYTEDWNHWNGPSARRDFYLIRPSFYWLKNDLAIARNRGDIIVVSLHDYNDSSDGSNFVNDVALFNRIMEEYKVSAVFAGHIHADCGMMENIPNTSIPFFRSGSASYQDYLIAKIDTTAKRMKVVKMACPWEGEYAPTSDEWPVALRDDIPNPPLPVPPTEGHVTFMNGGGFEAKFEMYYTWNGEDRQESTGTILKGTKRTYQIPPDATAVWIIGKENTGLVWEGWRTVFDLRFPGPPNNCFKLYGTTLSPKWNNDCN